MPCARCSGRTSSMLRRRTSSSISRKGCTMLCQSQNNPLHPNQKPPPTKSICLVLGGGVGAAILVLQNHAGQPTPTPSENHKEITVMFFGGAVFGGGGGACSQQTGIALQSCCESGSPPFASMGVEVPIGPQAIAIGARIQARSDMLESNNSILFLPILARSVCFSGPQARRALPARCGPIGSESVFWVQEKNSEPGFAIDERNDLVVEESCGQAPGPECPESSRLPQWGSVAGQSQVSRSPGWVHDVCCIVASAQVSRRSGAGLLGWTSLGSGA